MASLKGKNTITLQQFLMLFQCIQELIPVQKNPKKTKRQAKKFRFNKMILNSYDSLSTSSVQKALRLVH